MSIQFVHFMSRVNAEACKGHAQTAVIAIGDPAAWPSKLSPAFGAVHRLEFNDVDTDDDEHYVLFDKALADSVWDFIGSLPEDVDTLVVHCHLGVSRSAAIAKSVAQYVGAPYPESYSLYNKRVYQVMQSALNARLYPGAQIEY